MRELYLGDKDTLTKDKLSLNLALAGMKVIVSPHIQPVPKLNLSADLTCCSLGFRLNMDDWLLGFFGTKDVAYMMNGSIIMSPKCYAAVRLIV